MKIAVVDLNLLLIKEGDHTLYVKSTGDSYGDSLHSKIARYDVLGKLAAPKIVLEGDTVKWIIKQVDAEKFALFIDGEEKVENENGRFDLSSFNLSVASHKITMRSRDAGYNIYGSSLYAVGYNESDDSNSVTYEVYEGTSGLAYELVDNSYYKCSGIGTATTIPNIKISSKYSGFIATYPVKGINDRAFKDNTVLQSVEIPSSVLTIGAYAFSRCTNLSRISIANGVTSIGNYAFQHCALTEITIPSSVLTIGDYAFYFCESVASLTISNGVTSIGEGAFEVLELLTSVTIPKTVTSIGKWAFDGCKSLITIKFEGTINEWDAITKGSEWNSSVPATQVVCSDGTVAL